MLTCTAMRGMEWMPLQQETLPTISLYDVLSNQVILLDNSMQHPFPSLPRATLMDSTLDSEPLAPVLTFYIFRSTLESHLEGLPVL